MLPRTLEPEVMDTAEEARDYDTMDHADVNRRFVAEFLDAWRSDSGNRPESPHFLDVGAGTAQIPIVLANEYESCRITAIDLAAEMLKLAYRNVANAGLTDRVALEQVDAKQMPCADASFDAVISNSIVHHIPQPLDVFREMVRVLKPGGLLFVRDLLRPESADTVEHLVATYAGDENAHQQQLFRQSLQAALTIAEVQEVLSVLGLPTEWVMQTSDRHWTVCGRT
jgi:ubiquinone/menaquinone biosynthesis C-methylase UbiE